MSYVRVMPLHGPDPISWSEHNEVHAGELPSYPGGRYVLNPARNPQDLYCWRCKIRVARPTEEERADAVRTQMLREDQQRQQDFAEQQRQVRAELDANGPAPYAEQDWLKRTPLPWP